MKKLIFASLLVVGSIANASAAYIWIDGSFSADHSPPGATITCDGPNGCGTLNDVTCVFTDVNGYSWQLKGVPPPTPPSPQEIADLIEDLHTVGVYAILKTTGGEPEPEP